MKDIELSVQDIKDLIGALSKNHMGGFKLQQGNFTLEIKSPEVAAKTVTVAAAASAQATVSDEPEAMSKGNIVKSPIVGTFYASSAPDKPAYVSAGSAVKRGDVLFIIESMKLMNEVTSEFDGVVTEVLVSNAQGVEYGQPVMIIE